MHVKDRIGITICHDLLDEREPTLGVRGFRVRGTTDTHPHPSSASHRGHGTPTNPLTYARQT